MDETPPTNELIERLTSRLSPEGREAQAELDSITQTINANTPEAEAQALVEEALALVAALPEDDQLLVRQIARLKERAFEIRAAEYLDKAETLEGAETLMLRALDLERAAGREPDEGSLTLAEALAILERHGEGIAGPEGH